MQKLCCVCTRQQFSASLVYLVTSLPPYLHQFSTISGGNCIIGHPSLPFRTPSRSLPGMALLLQPKTILRSISKPEILSLTSPATDTVFSDTPAIADRSTMAQFFCGRCVMHMASRAPSNSSTPWLIISGIGEPCTPLSVEEAPMKSPRRSLTSSDHSLLLITSLNPIISTKARLRIDG